MSMTKASTNAVSRKVIGISGKAGRPVLACPAMQASTPTAEWGATAAFIADMSTDLVELARRQGFNALAFVLDLAKVEALSLALKNDAGNRGYGEPRIPALRRHRRAADRDPGPRPRAGRWPGVRLAGYREVTAMDGSRRWML
jgi:hypothetical protein